MRIAASLAPLIPPTLQVGFFRQAHTSCHLFWELGLSNDIVKVDRFSLTVPRNGYTICSESRAQNLERGDNDVDPLHGECSASGEHRSPDSLPQFKVNEFQMS